MREFAVEFHCGLTVGLIGFLWSVEHTEVLIPKISRPPLPLPFIYPREASRISIQQGWSGAAGGSQPSAAPIV